MGTSFSPRATSSATAAAAGDSSNQPRRLILLFGYWPPTDIGIQGRQGILWKWKTKTTYRGYDVLAISPTFQNPIGVGPGGVPEWGAGQGQLTVDYFNTSADFWSIVKDNRPIAIMSFSRGNNDKSWEIEASARNLAQANWGADFQNHQPRAGGSAQDSSPYSGQLGPIAGSPPDPSQNAGQSRPSNLPMTAIRDGVNAAFPNGDIVAAIDNSGNVGAFVSEYMAYHVGWYRDYSQSNFANLPQNEQCIKAGHTHVGIQVDGVKGQDAVQIQLDKLIDGL